MSRGILNQRNVKKGDYVIIQKDKETLATPVTNVNETGFYCGKQYYSFNGEPGDKIGPEPIMLLKAQETANLEGLEMLFDTNKDLSIL